MVKKFFKIFLHFQIFNLYYLSKNKIEPIEPKLDFSLYRPILPILALRSPITTENRESEILLPQSLSCSRTDPCHLLRNHGSVRSIARHSYCHASHEVSPFPAVIISPFTGLNSRRNFAVFGDKISAILWTSFQHFRVQDLY